jgi:hypothetical protein
MNLTILYFIVTIVMKVMSIIPSTMGIHLGDPLGGRLFILTHFRVLHSIASCFPSCLFASSAYDIHIIAPPPPQLYHMHMNISKLNFM